MLPSSQLRNAEGQGSLRIEILSQGHCLECLELKPVFIQSSKECQHCCSFETTDITENYMCSHSYQSYIEQRHN